jgi:RHS repeat-associated protein
MPGMAIVLFACLAVLARPVAAQVFDDFESYAVGSNLHGQGGWAGWMGNASAGALVSTNFSFSPIRSVNINGASDLVHTFSGATNGQWVFRVMQYIPSSSTGVSYVILMNTYQAPYGTSNLSWSVQIPCNLATGQIISDYGGGATLPMLKDQWVEFRCEINLASNSVSEFYNGQLLSTHLWQGGGGGPGLNEIQALDLFANNAGPVYYDNVSLALQSQAADTLHLYIARTNSNVVLTWTNAAAALESSLMLPGAWSVVTGALSPRVISPTNPASFFRLQATNTSISFAYLYDAPTFSSSIGDPFGCGCVSPENPNTLGTVGGAQDNGLGSVLLQTGELTQDGVALEIPGRGFNWRFEMRYRSGMSYNGPVGQGGWDFNYNRRLAIQTNGDVLCVNGLGRVDAYTHNANGTFTSPAGFFTQLATNGSGGFNESDRHGNINIYSAPNSLGIAQLSSISDRNGNQMIFQYNPASQLTNAVDTLGRSITYDYDTNGRLTSVTDFGGRAMRFTYNANGDLASVTSPAVIGTPNGNDFPSGKTTLYTYSSGFTDPNLNHNLLTVTAPNEAAVSGPPRLLAQYDTNTSSTNVGRLVSLNLGGTNGTGVGAGGTLSYGYTSLGVVGATDYTTPQFQTVVTNRNGNVTQYQFNRLGNVVSQVQYTRAIRAGDPASYTSGFAYNADGLMISQTNPALSSVQYVYDSGNSNRLAQGNLLQTVRQAGPRGGDQNQIVVANIYETNFNFVASITDGRGDTMTIKYDMYGNKTNVVHRLSSIVDDYTYNTSGQMTSHTLPDNGSNHRRIDLMVYYSSGPQTGYLQQSIVDSGGFNLTTTYAYNVAGNVTNSIDARGSNTIYVVNSLNQVVLTYSRAVTTTNGPVRYQVTYFYDANNNVLRTDVQNIDDGGKLVAALPNITTTNQFDILDARLATVQQVSSSHFITTAYQYDADGNRTLTSSGVATSGLQTNNVVQTLFDERNLVFHIIRAPNDPGHATTQCDYDPNQNRVRLFQGTEANPRITTNSFDGFDRQMTATDPMGNVVTTHYDPNGNRVSSRVDGELVDVPGSAGNVLLSQMTYTYDQEDRRTVSDAAFLDPTTQTNIGSGHAITTTSYNGKSQVLTVTDANSNVSTVVYDGACRRSIVTDAKSNTVTYIYDPNNNVTEKTEVDLSDLGTPSQSFLTSYVYDNLDRRIQSLDNIGNTNRFAFDSRGNRAAVTDGRGNVRRYAFDGLKRLTTTTRFLTSNGLGSGTPVGSIVTSQSWDDDSRLSTQTDANSNTTAYVYDALNRWTVSMFADGTTNTTSYDVHNNAVMSVDANGTVVTSIFDLRNRVLTNFISRAPGVVGPTLRTFAYDGRSRRVSATDDNSAITFHYDSLSHATTETQQVLPGGPDNKTTRVYDGVGNLILLNYPGGRTISRSYNAVNRLTLVENVSPGSNYNIASYQFIGRRVQARNSANGALLQISYDGDRRPTNSLYTTFGGSVTIDNRFYAWDAANNKVSVSVLSSSLPESKTFNYDSVSRLIGSVTSGTGPSIGYTFDGVGNRESVTGGPDPGSYSMSAAFPEPADLQMNQYTATPFDTRNYDRKGNLLTNSAGIFAYDFLNRLTQFIQPGVTTNIYTYDCQGRRLAKNENGFVTLYCYSGWREIEEQNSTNVSQTTYVWGRGMDELLEMDRGDHRYYFHSDNQGSITRVTDGSGNLAEQYAYGDYGEPSFYSGADSSVSTTQIGNTTLFNGRRWDPETELYYYRTRYLEPDAGRFITRDTIGIWGDRFNVGNGYTYLGNNPATGIDPMGMDNPGCDSLFGNGSFTADPCKLACCAAHDLCYFENNCTAFSWLQGFSCVDSPCNACNSAVTACMLGCVSGYTPQPSTCNFFDAYRGVFTTVEVCSDGTCACYNDIYFQYNGGGGGNGGQGGGGEDINLTWGSNTDFGDGGPRCCFIRDTPVHTPDGLKLIQDVNIGDYVLTYNEWNRTIEPKRVTKLIQTRRADLLQLNVGTDVITCTRDHRFYTSECEWAPAETLTALDLLMVLQREKRILLEGSVVVLEARQTHPVTVYNLSVEDNRNYFVGVSGVLCHNDYEDPFDIGNTYHYFCGDVVGADVTGSSGSNSNAQNSNCPKQAQPLQQ